MLRSIFSLGVAVLVSLSVLQSGNAGPLTSAEVTKVINRVAVVDPAKGQLPAKVRDVIKDDLGLQTGEKSRSELLFQDNTLTRIGAETFFSFRTGTRDMTLEKGSMLLQVPKGLGGATIHTAAVTAAITGTTIMMEYVPNRYIKVLVLEGSLRLSRNGRFGDSLVLRPGKMVIMRPDAKRIPEPVDVDIKHIVRTSTLVNFPDSAPLPSMGLIQGEIDSQTRSIARNDLVPTNLVMGHGTDVVIASPDQLAQITALTPAAVNSASVSTPTASPVSEPSPVGTQVPAAPITAPAGIVQPIAGDTVTGLTSSVPNNLAGPLTSAPATLDSVTNTVTSLPVVNSLANTVGSVPATLDTVTSTVTSPVLNLVATTGSSVPATLDTVANTITSLPVLNSITPLANPLPATLDSVTGTLTSLPIVNSITTTASSLPARLESVTGSVTSLPAVNSLTTTATSVPATLTSVTNTLAALPVLNSGANPVSPTSLTSAAPPLSSVTSLVGTTSSLPAIGSITGSSTASASSVASPTTTITAILTPTTSSVSQAATVSTTPANTSTQTVPISSSTQLLNILSNVAPTSSGSTTTSPNTSATVAPSLSSNTTAVTTASPAPVTSATSILGTITTVTAAPTTGTQTLLPVPVTTTATTTAATAAKSLLGWRH